MVKIDAVAAGLLTELNKEGNNLAVRTRELSQARASYDVASRKYAAIRDMITEFLGINPYHQSVQWPLEAVQPFNGQVYRANRFVHLKPGDATVMALTELDAPSTMEEIVAQISKGGMNIAPRAVNASLMRTAGVEKKEGKYRYVEGPPMDDIDDLPF